jgi:hypothetical protein
VREKIANYGPTLINMNSLFFPDVKDGVTEEEWVRAFPALASQQHPQTTTAAALSRKRIESAAPDPYTYLGKDPK